MSKNRFRKNIAKMKGYVPGFQPKDPGWVKLNTNENPCPPPKAVMDALRDIPPEKLALYPPPMWDILRKKYAEMLGFAPEMVLAGNGSDEILAIIMRCFLGEGDTLLITDPTYSLFDVLAQIQGAKTKKVALEKEFALPEKIFGMPAELVMVSNPNPPSGALYSLEKMSRLCAEAAGIAVIDEAYVDFSCADCLSLIKKHENLIITRTFSKSYSLAGLRIGFAIAQKPLIDGMIKVKDSYNLNIISQTVAIAAIDARDYFMTNIKTIIAERERLSDELRAMGWKVFPSEANFILAGPAKISAREIFERLKQQKILVRFFDKPGLDRYLRITIGTRGQTETLLAALRKM